MPDLWPKSLRTDILSPVAILRTQAGLLKDRTQGVLEGRVTTGHDFRTPSPLLHHRFEVHAPGLRYNRELLAARHAQEAPYPVYMVCDYVNHDDMPDWSFVVENGEPQDGVWEATSQSEFVQLLGKALKHSHAVTLLESLIARVNDESAERV